MPQIESLGQVALTVNDVAAMTAFYRDIVGLPFGFSAGPNLSFFILGDVRMMISRAEDGVAASGNSVLYFRVTSVDDAFAAGKGKLDYVDAPHMIAKMPDHELWMVFFKDPERNLMGFMEERRPA